MATTTKTSTKSGTKDASENLQKFIDGLQANEKSASTRSRRFRRHRQRRLPRLRRGRPRSKIIDAALSMTQQIVESSNKMARTLVGVTEDALDNIARSNDRVRTERRPGGGRRRQEVGAARTRLPPGSPPDPRALQPHFRPEVRG